jgi:hypothetical protein
MRRDHENVDLSLEVLDDRLRPGEEPTLTAEAKAWVVNDS